MKMFLIVLTVAVSICVCPADVRSKTLVATTNIIGVELKSVTNNIWQVEFLDSNGVKKDVDYRVVQVEVIGGYKFAMSYPLIVPTKYPVIIECENTSIGKIVQWVPMYSGQIPTRKLEGFEIWVDVSKNSSVLRETSIGRLYTGGIFEPASILRFSTPRKILDLRSMKVP